MEFPTLVYRCPGEHHAHGGQTYQYIHAINQEDFDAKIAAGWHETLVIAVDAVVNSKQDQKQESSKVESDEVPPTRVEMEEKAKELGIKFDGRTGDKKLLAMINEKL